MKPIIILPAEQNERTPDMEVTFTVPALPVAQPRPRATVGHGGHARMYEAKSEHKIHSFKATVRMAARVAYSGAPIEGPLYVGLTFVFPRPKSLLWKSKPMPRIPKTSKPDCDNLVKACLDAMNGLIFLDDAQVCDCYCKKVIASGDEQPHVEIKVRVLEGAT